LGLLHSHHPSLLGRETQLGQGKAKPLQVDQGWTSGRCQVELN
jgi:hypothetical protein